MAKPSCLLLFLSLGLVLGLGLCVPAFAQYTPAVPMIFVTADPSGACGLNVPLRYNTSNGKLWGCDSGTWAQISGGGGGGSPAGTFGAVQFNGGGIFSGNAANQYVTNTSLSTPVSGPALSTFGTPGAASYTYQLSAINPIGSTLAGPASTIATGNAALDSSNYVIVTPPACQTNQTGWNVYGGSAGGPYYLGTFVCATTFHDIGAGSPGVWGGPFSLPLGNTTQGFYLQGNLAVTGSTRFGNNTSNTYQDQSVEVYAGQTFWDFGQIYDGTADQMINPGASPIGMNIDLTFTNLNGDNATALEVVLQNSAGNTQTTSNPQALTVWNWKLNPTVDDDDALDGIQSWNQVDAGTVFTNRGIRSITKTRNTAATVEQVGFKSDLTVDSGAVATNAFHYGMVTRGGGSPGITNLYGYYSDVGLGFASGGTWQFYGAGDAPSYFGGPIDQVPLTLLQINALTSPDGRIGYCSDCNVTSSLDDTCTSGGSGATFAKLNGVLRCRI